MKHLFFATEFEAEPFISALGPFSKEGNIFQSDDVKIIIIGIGLVNSGLNTLNYLIENNPAQSDELINLGIAGSANKQLKLGDVASIKTVDIFTSESIPKSSQHIWDSAYPQINLKGQFSLGSSTQPVWSQNGKNAALTSSIDLIDMEGYSFAQSCKQRNLEPQLYKSVSDSLSKDSQENFIKNAKFAIQKLFDFYQKSK